ncbi:hypothetical protein CROQUDRAFT_137074 [Cronartium quercuum f. sp. fusiforme G11]|uniref:Phosphoribulokinase/uridine kinase domain-containing protein n=1 Tax=Cronartium quercuum f. sp. fusiforme G11 TaxID=708437 RepID=A0A9P6N604_9BASI|nr:hypothetical protein CROQUDRAFT_137074 [Cronartium quercuum f. sp. fusiforme G11]
MDAQIERLASAIVEEAARKQSKAKCEQARFLVGIAGRAGSGKTRVAERLVEQLNRIGEDAGCRAMASREIGRVRGWYAAHGSGIPDPVLAHARRGSPETFDAKAYGRFLNNLVGLGTAIEAPTFSHSLKDPVEGGMRIESEVSIVVLEGLYTLYTETEDWARACEKMDFKVFLSVSESVSKARLIRRHVNSGICSDEIEAEQRVEENDLPNGRRLMRYLSAKDWVLESVEDPLMMSEMA